MTETDVAPSRLDRAKHKIRDFLDLRAGARTALVVYAGSAHMVLPMTEDPLVMVPYLEGLSPEIMPRDGNMAEPALELAQDILSEENAPGGIFWVADAIDPADVSALNASDTPLVLLAMRSPSGDDRGLSSLNVSTVSLTPDSADIRRIDSQLNVAFLRAQLEDAAQPWNDRAHWMAWPAALFLLAWFRRGWTMRWVFVAFISMACVSPASVRAGAADWFLTADQQGRLAFDRLDFSRAAALFADPSWRGFALYKSGQYTDAVTVLSRVETAWAASIQGLAQVKSRSYRDAIVSFETALARDPNYPGAADNLALAKQILEHVESAREQSDTGEESGLGADDTVFDNEDARGADTQIDAGEDSPTLLSADQWMNTVDTRTSDFLRLRFALEASSKPSDEDEK